MTNMKGGAESPQWLDDDTLGAVRPAVRELLLSSSGFRALPADEQRALAQTMVKVSAYMANPGGVATEEKKAPVLARAQADAVGTLKERLAKAPGFTGAEFKAGAAREGVEQFGQMVKTVDFPAFVSGLIQNVFQAIVDSSIQQMRAYGELLANVAKSVDDFARDDITENNARDWLSDKFPGQLGVEAEGMSGGFAEGSEEPALVPRLAAPGENPEDDLKTICTELGVTPPVRDLSDEAEERRLVLGARLAIARGRQQLLASMIMLGINRIVVTDGLINAKVVFDMRAQDTAKRVAKASMYDTEAQRTRSGFQTSFSSWLSPASASAYGEASTEHVATVSSSVDETSESKAEVKAKLTGEVRVNFKSDFMPMEKMASPEMIAAIQGNARPPERRVEGA